MKLRKLIWLTSLAMMTLIFVACNTSGDAGSNDSGTPTSDSNTVTLSQTASVDESLIGSAFTISFPEGWSQSIVQSAITLTNNPEVINNLDGDKKLPTGAIALNISVQNAVDGITTPSSLIQNFIDLATSAGTPLDYDDIVTTSIGEYSGAQATGTFEGSDNMLLAVDHNGQFVIAIVLTPEGELNSHLDVVKAIIDSVELPSTE